MNNGFVRVAAGIPQLRVADCLFNADRIVELAEKAEQEGVEVICFPELCLTAYTCGDLFFQQQLQSQLWQALSELLQRTRHLEVILIVGLPYPVKNRLFNTAAILERGEIKGILPKTYIPNSGEFSEKRWFTSGMQNRESCVLFEGKSIPFGRDLLFSTGDFVFGVEICEDLWTPTPPSTTQAREGAQIIFNLSASNDLVAKHERRRNLVVQQSLRCKAGYVYASAGFGESSTDLVFGGNALIAEAGNMLAEAERFSLQPQILISEIDIERLQADRMRAPAHDCDQNQGNSFRVLSLAGSSKRFSTLKRRINPRPFVPTPTQRDETCREVLSIQSTGLAKRWLHSRAENLILGISGGLDSTLALLVCIHTADKLSYDRRRIIGVTMPGFGTTSRTYSNALKLMENLGITSREIDIKKACLQHFSDIGHDTDQHDATYENVQARERTQILMDLANKHKGLVVGTGDLSELALGWTTYNGDHMSMYAVNSGVPKTLIPHLLLRKAQELDESSQNILQDILETPVSPELLPADKAGNIIQKTEDIVGPYELHDFFLYQYLRFGFGAEKILFLAEQAFAGSYSKESLKKWLNTFWQRFHSQQFKRSCMPDGPKIGSVSLSPRSDWKMPSDAALNLE